MELVGVVADGEVDLRCPVVRQRALNQRRADTHWWAGRTNFFERLEETLLREVSPTVLPVSPVGRCWWRQGTGAGRTKDRSCPT